MSSTACVSLTPLASALFRGPGLDRGREPGILEPLSWRLELSGWEGWRDSTKRSWWSLRAKSHQILRFFPYFPRTAIPLLS